jgi:hypothetical protein
LTADDFELRVDSKLQPLAFSRKSPPVALTKRSS